MHTGCFAKYLRINVAFKVNGRTGIHALSHIFLSDVSVETLMPEAIAVCSEKGLSTLNPGVEIEQPSVTDVLTEGFFFFWYCISFFFFFNLLLKYQSIF